MRLDDFMPEYEFDENHAVNIHASPEQVFTAMQELTIAELSPLIFLLLGIRTLPARLLKREDPEAFQPGPFLEQMYKGGFIPLAEQAGSEIVFGLVGQFWKLTGGDDPHILDPQAFLAFNNPDYGKVAANLLVNVNERGCTKCSTETRVHLPGQTARRKFALYWRIISMGSAFIRILWLRAIKRKAEKERGI